MPEKKKGYLNIQEKAAKGEYTLVEPFDYYLLELLPDEGELVMGYYPLVKNSEQLVKERFKDLTPVQLAQDLRRLKLQNLAIRVRTRGTHERNVGFQRTAKGKKLYEDWAKTAKAANKKPEENK